jgi:uncharacterized protein (DUF2236 family)
VTGWHSVLKCYEMYGPGPLSTVEEQRYWEECVIAAELQTCKASDVPRSRDEVREYFAEVRPRLCTSERANRAMHYLLRTPRAQGKTKFATFSRLVAPATIATLPGWMRTMGGFDQPALLDKAIAPAVRAAVRVGSSPKNMTTALKVIAPMTGKVLERHLRDEQPLDPRVVTPAEIRERFPRGAIVPQAV